MLEDNASETAALARDITELTTSQLPQEKQEGEAAMIRTARELAARGSDWANGRGQAIGSIPPRIYMRWNLMLPGCWNDKQFVDEFLTDNPQCCAPGYKPKQHSLRHALDVGGSFYQANKSRINSDPS